MALRFSTGLRDGLLAGGALKALLAGGEIRLYSGPVPASVDAAIGPSNQVLCTIRNNNGAGLEFEAAAAGGVLSKSASQTWRGTNSAGGLAAFYRHVLSSDTNAASTTAMRIQGEVAVAGADMSISNPLLVQDAVQTLEAYSVALPEA